MFNCRINRSKSVINTHQRAFKMKEKIDNFTISKPNPLRGIIFQAMGKPA